MKILIIIISLITGFNIANAYSFECPANRPEYKECGSRWQMLWEMGERIKYEKAKELPSVTNINKLQSAYDALIISTGDYRANLIGQSQKDLIYSQIPSEAFFNATTTLGGIAADSGSISLKTMVLSAIGIIFIFLGGIFYRLYKKNDGK